VPQEIDPNVSEAELKAFVKKKSAHYNTVVIVPSDFRMKFWADVADLVVKAENLEAAVDQLKAKHVGLVVMVNKYDGIDLPNSACRILVLDGLPQARRSYERIETNMLAGSAHVIGRQIQRIEQGMGRGVRANDDYCVVLLMGSSLTRTMFTMGAKGDVFTGHPCSASRSPWRLRSNLVGRG
jgi:Rad3-related DNA helicase